MRNSSVPGLCAPRSDVLHQSVCEASSGGQGQGIDRTRGCVGTSGPQLRRSHESHKRNLCFSHSWPQVAFHNQHALQRSDARIRVLLVHRAEPDGLLNASHSTLTDSDGSTFESVMFCLLTAIPLTSGAPGCLCPWAVLHGMSSENHMSNRV